jgi:hypothetical protein
MAFSSKPPKSYDEITRQTVANPDMSFRPSHDEEQLARHRFGLETEHRPHPLSPRERSLRDRVREALMADPNLELHDVTIEIDEDEIILLGTVPGPATAIRIEQLAGAVLGARCVDNQLVVRGRA